VSVTESSLVGAGSEGTILTLLYNGHLEYWEPLLERRWQWQAGRVRRPGEPDAPELYPYALCEITVNFLRLARKLYDHLKINCPVQAAIELYNVGGFVLRPFHPETMEYAMRVHPPFGRDDLRTQRIEQPPDFNPDHLSLKLLEWIYQQFGYKRYHIPFFDQEGNFVLAPLGSTEISPGR